ncbi:Vacuolar cation/proton exchanger 5 [Glycine soja]|nr:Vacuolar cation/proton exchanger 5 [Glycine soja]
MPLAKRLEYVTKQLTLYTGDTDGVGGNLNASFGNATELIISICTCALKTGKIRAVQLSLLGSIFFNMLLVLGCEFHKEQVFNKCSLFNLACRKLLVNSGLLLMAVMGILFHAVLHYTHAKSMLGSQSCHFQDSAAASCLWPTSHAYFSSLKVKEVSMSL